ncbi:30S ribosomal protein S12 methylthiotransferase RimO [Thermostilla marina]
MSEFENAHVPSFSVVALGCPKNLVDAERMLGRLETEGFRFSPRVEGADFVVVNTCGFIQAARDESRHVIEEMLELKRNGVLGGVVVAGCLAERDRERLLEMYPEVDQILGVFARDDIVQIARRVMRGLEEQRTLFRPAPTRALEDSHRLRVTPRHLAYLKISEGCDRLCTFCAIPLIRGKHVSKPIDQVLAEARELAEDGVRELILVAQDLTYYGLDLEGRPMLADLLPPLAEIDGIEWIRLMYLYPMYIDDRLIEVLAGCPKILPYLDMPLQHCNDRMLKRMKRRVTRSQIEALIGELRSRIDGLVLRTTMIVGFPGETEEEFGELVRFVKQQRFERLGVFEYSREPGTPADRMRDHLPPEVVTARKAHLMEVQQEITFEWNRRQLGRRLDVILDARLPQREDVFVGRTYADAPEIDGVVYVSGEDLEIGRIVPCEICEVDGYDLVGRPCGR